MWPEKVAARIIIVFPQAHFRALLTERRQYAISQANYVNCATAGSVGLRSRFIPSIPETTVSPEVDRLRASGEGADSAFDRRTRRRVRITIYSADTSFPPSLSRDNGLVVRPASLSSEL